MSFGLLGLLKCARVGYNFDSFNIDDIFSVGQETETGQWIFLFFFLFIDYVFGSREQGLFFSQSNKSGGWQFRVGSEVLTM